MLFKVTKIINQDTFNVSPGWKWNNQVGDSVKINGYKVEQKDLTILLMSKDKLEKLIFNKEVKLTNPARIIDGILLCDVYLGDDNLATML